MLKAPATELSDSELALRLAQHDQAAFTLMMRRHNQLLYRVARAILRDDSEAEDALQDAYLLAYRNIDQYRADAKLSTWLTRIVVNEAIAKLRKRRRSAEILRIHGDEQQFNEVTMADQHADSPEREAIRTETRRLLENAIDTLPEAFRLVFVMRALQEMSGEDVAASLDIPEATVRSRFFRAKGLLREALSQQIDMAYDDAFSFDGQRCDRIVANTLARLNAALADQPDSK